jgi:hypothetical protein
MGPAKMYHQTQLIRRWLAPTCVRIIDFFMSGSLPVLSSVRRLVRFRRGMPTALLAVALFTPTAARAGCEYPTHAERIALDPPVHSTATPKPLSAPADKPCPCSGPTCDRRPFVPPASPSIESPRLQEWGCPIPRFVLVPPDSSICQGDAPVPRPIRVGLSIFRPPRLLS